MLRLPALRSSPPLSMRLPLLGCALLALCVLTPALSARESLSTFPQATLEIATHSGTQHFNIWIADSPAREQQGLMFVKNLASNQGMLFPQDEPRVMSMWMKNTLIPLDMLFIDANGMIVYIKHDATPQSESIITTPSSVVFTSSEPTLVKAVLEIAGGLSAKRDIEIGDQVRYSLFNPGVAVQP
jgi:uncharacterized membrane protein (UPF0127 family)